jgi:type II secretory pathway pseudopilin PulG
MKTHSSAFTRVELLATLVALGLLAALAAPLMGTTRAAGKEISCFNNLRQIGRAVHAWAGEHDGRAPWLTFQSDGGTRPNTGVASGNAWFQYLALSNQLGTPRILACPADTTVRAANSWGKFAGPGFRANGVSYSIGLHATPDNPRALLAADYNLRVSGVGTSCGPAGMNNVAFLQITGLPDPNIGWTNGLHFPFGHLLKNDGSVELTTSRRLAASLAEEGVGDNSNIHLLRAR